MSFTLVGVFPCLFCFCSSPKEDAEKKSEKTRKNAKKCVKDLFPKKSKNSSKKGVDTSEKQHSGFRSAENPNAENPQAEKQAQINTNEKINKNKKFSDKESIRPSTQRRKSQTNFQQSFNVGNAEKSEDERMMDDYTQKFEIYREVIKRNIDFYEFAGWLDMKLSITLDTLTARILKLSSDSRSRIEPVPFYSWWNTTDCRADSAVAPVAHEISPDHRF